jgi:hypothetical protein
LNKEGGECASREEEAAVEEDEEEEEGRVRYVKYM